MYEYKAQLDRVIDGDTLDVYIDVGFKILTHQRIRLDGIDTPEIFRVPKDSLEYKKGLKAKKFVEQRLKSNDNKMILQTKKWKEKFGRYIGIIGLNDTKISLNEELIVKKLAKRIKR